MVSSEYKPLEAYGLIGNLETCALVGEDGSIDWCCLPHLKSPSVFAAILDVDLGGHFAIRPAAPFQGTQRYRQGTNVLETEFSTDDGTVVLTDFMPMLSDDPDAPFSQPWVYRRVECLDGEVALDIDLAPRFDYARARTVVEPFENGVIARGNGEHVSLTSPTPLEVAGQDAHGTERLEAGDVHWYTLQYGQRKRPRSVDPEALLARTESYWRNWTHDCDPDGCIFDGPWHDDIVRSELVLNLLMHHHTGAIAAAPTTSLPEEIGGTRNWDYRFSWIRDAAFTVQALYKLGHVRETEDYFDWCLDVVHSDSETLQPFQPVFGLKGRKQLDEEILDHLSGYRDSAPVRIGNAARNQLQLDVYGELVHGLYETSCIGETITAATWETIESVVEYVCSFWDNKGSGMWEVRSEPENFVHSKVMCWVALDRAIEIARGGGFDAPIDYWTEVKAAIENAVLEQGYNESIGSFVRSFEADGLLDASLLRIPLVGFLPIDDPRVQGTIDAIRDRLTTEEGLVHRYEGEDGIAGGEGAFILCSFWLVDCLALSGETEEAKEIFQNLLEYASPLGLLAEEVVPGPNGLRGNYPQAFSHLGLINSAIYLQAASGDEDSVLPLHHGDHPSLS
jgi:GH15 family glucan-1,4-alpha-glucosidase